MVNRFNVICVYICLFLSAELTAQEIQPVNIYVDDSYPPYTYVEDGKLKGIYVDLVALAAKALSHTYDVHLIAAPWKRALMEIEAGRVFAILAPYQHNQERPFIWPYSLALLTEHVVAYCHNDINLNDILASETTSVDQPLYIGVNAGYILFNDAINQKIASGQIQVIENRSTLANIHKLHSRRVDCYANDDLAIKWHFNQLKYNKELTFSHLSKVLTISSETAHIGYTNVRSEAYPFKADFIEKMDEALAELIQSPEYDAIISRYF